MNLALFDFDGTITSSDRLDAVHADGRSARARSDMAMVALTSSVVVGTTDWGCLEGTSVATFAIGADAARAEPKAFIGLREPMREWRHPIRIAACRRGSSCRAEGRTSRIPANPPIGSSRSRPATVLPGTLQTHALERIDWHRSQGDDIVVVSASLDLYLAPWCAERGLKVICTTIEEQRGTLTGRYVDGDCSGAEKVRRIRAQYTLVQLSDRLRLRRQRRGPGNDGPRRQEVLPLERDRELGRGHIVRPPRCSST